MVSRDCCTQNEKAKETKRHPFKVASVVLCFSLLEVVCELSVWLAEEKSLSAQAKEKDKTRMDLGQRNQS
jgi:hypothetical protein